MVLSSLLQVCLVTASAFDQPQGSVSIESLLSDSSNTVPMSPSVPEALHSVTSAPIAYSEASIGNALGGQGNAESINPRRQPKINKAPPNIGATGQLMETLLDSSKQNTLQGDSLQSNGKTPVSEESRVIVAGIVEAFMHKQHLQLGEKRCLEDSVSQLTGDVVGTGKDVIVAVKGLMTMNGAGTGGLPSVTARTKERSQGNVVTSGIDAALKLTSLVTLATTLVKNCVQGDALRMLKKAGQHLIDMKYIGHRLVVSGVDIAHFLSDAIISYEQHHYHRFGKDIGTTLRKVILSSSSTGAQLPEGVPEEEIIQKTSEGLMDGFFVGGSDMEITDVARPDVDIKLDLHKCVADNQPFFKEIFLAIWNAIAQFSANGDQHGLQGSSDSGSPKWTGELMIALMQLPSALQKCDIDAETEGMFMEAIQTLGQVQVHIDFPKGRATFDEISKRMAKAVEDWTDWHFKSFGKEIGVMLREFVMMVYPMKYSIDQNGRLRRALSSARISNTNNQGFATSFLMFGIAGIALIVFAGFAAIRGMRSRAQTCPVVLEEIDAELAADERLDDELIE